MASCNVSELLRLALHDAVPVIEVELSLGAVALSIDAISTSDTGSYAQETDDSGLATLSFLPTYRNVHTSTVHPRVNVVTSFHTTSVPRPILIRSLWKRS